MSATAKTGADPSGRARSGRLTRAQRTAILKALADPKRFELLERIARSQCPLGCSEMRSALSISPATLSHHVKELQTAGLVDVKREGKYMFLSIRPDVLQELIGGLNGLVQAHCGAVPEPPGS